MLLEQLLRESNKWNWNPSTAIEKSENADILIATLKKHCSKFISESGGVPAYRGLKSWGTEVLKTTLYRKKIRTDRKPLDTSDEISSAIDKVVGEVAGFKPRSEGLFVTGSASTAKEYGAVQLVFVIGDFNCVYSPLIGDMYRTFDAHGLALHTLKEWAYPALREAAAVVFKDNPLAPFAQLPMSEIVRVYNDADDKKRGKFVEHFLNSVKKRAFVVNNLKKGLGGKKEVQIGGAEYFHVNIADLQRTTGLSVNRLMERLSVE